MEGNNPREPCIRLDAEQIDLTLAALAGLRAQINAALDHAVTANSPQAMRAVQWLGAIAQIERRLRAVIEHRQKAEGADPTAGPLHEQGNSTPRDTAPGQAPLATSPQGGDLGG